MSRAQNSDWLCVGDYVMGGYGMGGYVGYGMGGYVKTINQDPLRPKAGF